MRSAGDGINCKPVISCNKTAVEEMTVGATPTYLSTDEPIKRSLKVIGCISDPVKEPKAASLFP